MLTVSQVAQRLNVSRRLVYSLAAKCELTSYRFGTALRFDEGDVEAYVEASRTAAPQSQVRLRPSQAIKLCAADPEHELVRYFRDAGIKLRSAPAQK